MGFRPRPILNSPAEVVSNLPDCLTSRAVRRSPGPVPRWRLAREGPFLSEYSSSSLSCFGDGCAFRNTTYAGVCQSVGNGTGDVAAFFVSGPGYGCGSAAASGRVSNDY